eukprot:7135018-Prymnesium_polylepis.1
MTSSKLCKLQRRRPAPRSVAHQRCYSVAVGTVSVSVAQSVPGSWRAPACAGKKDAKSEGSSTRVRGPAAAVAGLPSCRSPSSRCVRDRAAHGERTVLEEWGTHNDRTISQKASFPARSSSKRRTSRMLGGLRPWLWRLGRPEAARHAASRRRSRQTIRSTC